MSSAIAELELAEAYAPVLPALMDQISSLNDGEQQALLRLLERASRSEDQPITELSLITDYLKVDPRRDDFTVFQQITSMKAPPMYKEYPHCESIPLARNLDQLEHSFRQVLHARASRRDFSGGPLSFAELSSLLHYTYGIRQHVFAYNDKDFPRRYAPSAGGLQSIEIYFVANAVEGLEQGLYHYNPARHAVELLDRGNLRRKVVQCCTYQQWVEHSSIVLFFTCNLERLLWKYGRRAYRFTHMDAGIASYNCQLVLTALRLRSSMVAGYIDDAVHNLLQVDGRNEFLALMIGVGRKTWELHPSDASSAPAAGS